MPDTSYLYCIYMDILNEFKIIHWLCTHTAIKKIINENILVEFGGARPKYVVVELPYIQVNEFLKTPSYHYVNFTNRTQSNF